MTKARQKPKQLSFPNLSPKASRKSGRKTDRKSSPQSDDGEHGGDVTKGKRKTRRPFDPKQALHVVLRSSKAHGEFSMLHPRHCNAIHALVDRLQKRRKVRVYRYANVGNHLHLLLGAKSRAEWQGFIRELSGGVAMIVTGARKGLALKPSAAAVDAATGTRAGAVDTGLAESAKRGFWDDLVYTRMVSWGRDFKNVANYVCTNLWEGAGVPVRRFLARGFRCLTISEDGAVLVSKNASQEILDALARYSALG